MCFYGQPYGPPMTNVVSVFQVYLQVAQAFCPSILPKHFAQVFCPFAQNMPKIYLYLFTISLLDVSSHHWLFLHPKRHLDVGTSISM